MGLRNYLIAGVSCAGKTTVGEVLRRRGYQVIHGDDELAYWGDPTTGDPVDRNSAAQRSWLWDVSKVRSLVSNQNHAATFFCGGSRNANHFIDLFDEVFVLEIDLATLNRRLAARPKDEWGGTASEGEAFARWQLETRDGLPEPAIVIDAAAPLAQVVEQILNNTASAAA